MPCEANKQVNKSVKLSKEVETDGVQVVDFRCGVWTGSNAGLMRWGSLQTLISAALLCPSQSSSSRCPQSP